MRPPSQTIPIASTLLLLGCADTTTYASGALTDQPTQSDAGFTDATPAEDAGVAVVDATGCPRRADAYGQFAILLIEDLSDEQTGADDNDTQGMLIDAISITQADGAEYFATGVADFNITGLPHIDPYDVVGAPDSRCTLDGVVGLGGAGGYLVVEFGRTFSSGDRVTVYELGPTMCPTRIDWRDEPFRLSMNETSTTDAFDPIGVGGGGVQSLCVP